MHTDAALEQRLERLEDRAAIMDLAILYGFVMDERDVAGIRRLFSTDATLKSQDGVFAAKGIDEIVATYEQRFAALGPTNHVSHGHVVRFDDADPDVAHGVVASHAEVWRNERPMVVGLRYKDQYRRTADGWRISNRLMSYMYYVDVREYASALGDQLRVRAYGEPRPADWPEVLTAEPDLRWLSDMLT